MAEGATNNKWPQIRERVDDVLDQVPDLFRLVDLIQDDGPDGITEKTVIDQHSLQLLLNTIQPGSWPSTGEIHFQDLDSVLSIKPLGIYGDRREIVRFLQRMGCLDNNSAALIMGQDSENGCSHSLPPGLYLALLPNELEKSIKGVYIVYWPEATTWDDGAISLAIRHNRTTFMRYLTKMTDQIVGLISSSQARALNVKNSGSNNNSSTEQTTEYYTNLSSFELVQSDDSGETGIISVHPGFNISIQPDLVPEKSRVCLISGERNVGLLVVEHESQSRGFNHHHIYPFTIDKRDTSLCGAAGAAESQPKIDIQHKFEFGLRRDRSIEFIHLIRDKCLLVISERGRTRVYVQDNLMIDHAINTTHGKRTLSHDSMGGSQCHFALDEGTRLFAIVHGKKGDQKLSTYVFDESFSELRSWNSPISLRGWYSKQTTVTKICFIPGLEEVCLADTSGRMHIYSLTKQQFCKGHLQIERLVFDMLPNPDPSSLLLIVPGETPSSSQVLQAIQWESLRTEQLVAGAFVAELAPSDGLRIVSSLGTNTMHLISFSRGSRTITGPTLNTTQTGVSLFQHAGLEEPCNSLLDCHLDVWSRYPIVAPEGMTLPSRNREPKELMLVSPVPLTKAQSYFSGLMSKLVAPKLSEASLLSLAVLDSAEDELHCHPGSSKVSQFSLGAYIQELLCLVPLHLMVTKGSQLYFMYGGVWSPSHAMPSDGDIAHITDTLSLGWYEPLIRFHSPSKPVRIVSSIGDRGVGKTYSLDHLANTSFGACGDRHSQGVWLSCTSTNEYFLVALDFKGVHLMEPNNETSTLMGLFSAAISNLVILRENFTVTYYSSRIIAGLLSFAKFMDPDDSPVLFNSTLTIIVKDASDPNSNVIIKEFSCELQKHIEHTDERNVVPSLHHGGIQVIPWPVINTTDFYAMFTHLHKLLLKGQPAHPSGSVFLHALKIMMAKIKAHDWAPLDQSLATYRAKKLLGRLPSALSDGRDELGSLRNMQTNEYLCVGHDRVNLTFWVPTLGNSNPEVSTSETLNEQSLFMKQLVDSYGTDLEHRQRTRDSDYVKTIQKRIHKILEQRLELVQQWAMANTEPFPQDNQHICEFLQKLAMAKTAMRNATLICASQCNQCMLLCLNVLHHSGEHDCWTNHICIFDCDLSRPGERREPCGLP
ncbi:unnamed protein product [Rhizoctonia solani]|uniref:Uncharacterized protein n=1 Tax=Rhizoctonia solani TaxID=456999 RepID=A0A8H3B153_9AGAM|nr:unnamed protein product [Rhizoctonia solani]